MMSLSDHYPPGYLVMEEHVKCSNCDHVYPYDDALECPLCDEEVMCPSCQYCQSCNVLMSELWACECGSGEMTDGDSCSKCFDEEEGE